MSRSAGACIIYFTVLSPGTRLGPYEIVAHVGTGGMGEVYKAHDSRLARTIALKILPAHLADADSHRTSPPIPTVSSDSSERRDLRLR